jgi:hypothetical protein
MKYLIALPISWLLWLLGDIMYRILELNDSNEKWCSFWYTFYNGLMIASADVQQWGGWHQPWFPWGDPPK